MQFFRMDRFGTWEFYLDLVTTRDGTDLAYVFIERDLLLPLTEVGDIHKDGTFSTVSSIFAQLAKTHIVKFNRALVIIV